MHLSAKRSEREIRPLSRRERRRLLLEALEPRTLLSQTWIVGDTGVATTNGANLNNILNGTSIGTGGHPLQLGDTIVLTHGATYSRSGGFTLLGLTAGTGTVTIETDDLTALPANTRVDPNNPTEAAAFAKVESIGTNNSIFKTAPDPGSGTPAHDYTLLGLEVLPSNNTTDVINAFIKIGDVGTAQDTTAQVPYNFTIDRCYVHGWDIVNSTTYANYSVAITLNGSNQTVSNCYIDDIHRDTPECHGIDGWNGTSGYTITNNFVEASSENIFFGGADTAIPNNDPTNITISHNYFTKRAVWDLYDPSFDGVHTDVKNMMEFKHATNILIDSNIFENAWVAADQVGVGIVVNPIDANGGNTWDLIHNVTISNNVIRNVGEGINLGFNTPAGAGYTCLPMHDVLVENNLIYNANGGPSNGVGVGFNIGATHAAGYNLTIDHNTVFSAENFMQLSAGPGHDLLTSGFTVTNNLFLYGQAGLFSSVGEGVNALNALTPGWSFSNNAILAAGPTVATTLYPSGTLFESTEDSTDFLDTPGDYYGLLSTSPLHGAGTLGSDIGVNFSALSGIADFVPVDATLQNYYKFDENTGTVSTDYGNGTHHNATLSSSTLWTANGEINSGIAMTGGTSGSASVSSFSTTANFSYVAWVKPTSFSATQYIGSTANSAFSLSVNTSGKLVATGKTGSVTATTAMTAGNWYMVGVTFDGTTLTLYLDGVAVGSVAATTATGSTTLTIGGNNGSVSSFNGTIDEVRYYSSALSAPQETGLPPGVTSITKMQSLYNGLGPIFGPIAPGTAVQTGTTTKLTATAVTHDDFYPGMHNSAASLTYSWSLFSGPSTVSFSVNNSNAAQNTTVTWTAAGNYVLELTVTDGLGGSSSALHPLSVAQTPQGTVSISPNPATVAVNGTQTFTNSRGTGLDQFGAALNGTWTWSISAGTGSALGTLSTTVGTGSTLYTAPATAGTNTLTLKFKDSNGEATSYTDTITIGTSSPPGAPSNLTAAPGTGNVILNWTDNDTSNTTGYHIYRSTDNSTWGTAIGNIVSATATTFTDSTPTAGTAYYYKVDSYNSSGDSSDTLGQNDITCAVATFTAYESFNYTVGGGSNLAGHDTAAGFAGNWSVSSTTNVSVVSGSISYSSGTHTLTTANNSVKLNPNSNANITFANSIGTAGTTLWVGFEFNATHTTGTIQSEIDLNSTGTATGLRLGAASSGDVGIRVTVGSFGSTLNSTTAVPNNTPVFVAYRIQYLATGDIIDMYVDPTPGVTPTSNGTLTLPATVTLPVNANMYLWSANANTTTTFDEIRLGVSYAAVAPDPLVATPTPIYASTSAVTVPASLPGHAIFQTFLASAPTAVAPIDLSLAAPATSYHLEAQPTDNQDVSDPNTIDKFVSALLIDFTT